MTATPDPTPTAAPEPAPSATPPAHPAGRPGTYRFAGLSLVLAAALLLARAVLEGVLGAPPTTGEGLLAWASANAPLVAAVNELVVIGTVLLTPGVVALFRVLDGARSGWAALGVGLLALTIPLTLVLGTVHGRLVYPVYGLDIDDPASALLVASVYYGGQHMVSLMFAAGVVVIALVVRRSSRWAGVAALGMLAGPAQVVVSFPGVVHPLAALVLQALLVAWLALVGVRLSQRRRAPRRWSPTQ